MVLFSECHHTSEHFKRCYDNCKWHDYTAHYSVHNNDVLIVISDDENDNDVNENEHIAKLRQIALTLLLTETVIIDLNL